MRVIIYPYKLYSKSCADIVAALRQEIDYKTIRVRGSGRYRRRNNDLLVNWGNSERPQWNSEGMLNRPEAVRVAVNKLATLEALSGAGVSCVPFTRSMSDAAVKWGKIGPVVVRHKLEGHSGDGIEIVAKGSKLPAAPLYTQFIQKSVEYRVHVFRGEIIDYTKKIKRTPDGIVSRIKDDYIRSNTQGWEYIRDVAPRQSVCDLAIAAVEALGLDFGAVDIIRSKRTNYVLEVGTAAGLSSIGVAAYCRAISSLVESSRATPSTSSRRN